MADLSDARLRFLRPNMEIDRASIVVLRSELNSLIDEIERRRAADLASAASSQADVKSAQAGDSTPAPALASRASRKAAAKPTSRKTRP